MTSTARINHDAARTAPAEAHRVDQGQVTPDRGDFQQAKTADNGPQFLQIVAKPDRTSHKKSKTRDEPKLTRVAFKVSRDGVLHPPRAPEPDRAFIR
jgi:hypothetical protein